MTISTRAPRLAAVTRRSARPAPPAGRRPKRRLALLLAPLLVLGLAACQPTAQQESVRSLVNVSRSDHGVHRIGGDSILDYKAQRWAEHLASIGTLAHSKLSSGLDGLAWGAVAENVGRGSSIASVHESYMASAGHKANILDRRWDRVGTGHAVGRDGRVYTVQVFVDLR